MGKKENRLCKWKEKAIKDNFEVFKNMVKSPIFVCEKCGRVADKKKWLHNPVPLK